MGEPPRHAPGRRDRSQHSSEGSGDTGRPAWAPRLGAGGEEACRLAWAVPAGDKSCLSSARENTEHPQSSGAFLNECQEGIRCISRGRGKPLRATLRPLRHHCCPEPDSASAETLAGWAAAREGVCHLSLPRNQWSGLPLSRRGGNSGIKGASALVH